MGSEITINKVVYDPTKYKDGGLVSYAYIKWMGAEIPYLHEKYKLSNNICGLLRMMFDYFSIKKENWDEFINNLKYDNSISPTIKHIMKDELYILYFHNEHDITDIRNKN